MKVVIKPPRLVCIKLGVIDEKNGKLTGVKFSVKYHDMPHVVDFVILRQFYEKAIERNWRPNDRFRCIIDENWYFGSIQAKNPFQEQYPRSPFQCLTVLWDNNDVEAMSPWDLEPLSINGRKSKPAAAVPADGGGILITADELKSLLYTPEPDEWPGVGREYECSRILNGLSKIMELSIAEPFNFPVDLDEFPLYAKTIEYPIDLNTIRERLANLYYRRITAIQWDVRKIEQNAARFNEPKSNIVKEVEKINLFKNF
jgi:bromodomain and WD repeat domain-containing protein 1/3